MGDGDGTQGAGMNMSRGYDAWRTQGPPDSDHHPRCPAHEDADEVYSECGGNNECLCPSPAASAAVGACVIVEPECACADLADDDKASAADAREAAREEGWERP